MKEESRFDYDGEVPAFWIIPTFIIVVLGWVITMNSRGN